MLRRNPIIAPAFAALLFASVRPVSASTDTWTQYDWSGGASAATASHPADRFGWNLFQTKSGTVTFVGGTGLQTISVISSWLTTDDSVGTNGFKSTGPSLGLGVYGAGAEANLALGANDTPGARWSLAYVPGPVNGGGTLISTGTGADFLYAFRGSNSQTFYRYSISWNIWQSMMIAPGNVSQGAAMAYPGAGDYIYAEKGTGSNAFWRYSISGNSWAIMTVAPGTFGPGAGLISTGTASDYIFAMQGNNSNAIWRYSITGDNWTAMTAAPSNVWYGGTMAYPGAGDYIYVLGGSPGTGQALMRYSISGNNWTAMQNTPARVFYGGMHFTSTGTGSNYLYALRSDNTDSFWRYNIAGDNWETMANAPNTAYDGCSLHYPGTGDFIYALRGQGLENFWRYSLSQDKWLTPSSAGDAANGGGALAYVPSVDAVYRYGLWAGSSMDRFLVTQNRWVSGTAAPGSISYGDLHYPGFGDFIYALRGGGSSDFYRYSISGDNWATMTAAPGTMYYGAKLVYPGSGDYIYASRGNNTSDFYRYSISGDSWEIMTNLPGIMSYGGSLVYPGTGDYIYGANSANFWRYSVSGDSWQAMTGPPAAFALGGGLGYPGSGDYIYALRGNSSALFRYSISTDVWETLDSLPENVGNTAGTLEFDGDGNAYTFIASGRLGFYRFGPLSRPTTGFYTSTVFDTGGQFDYYDVSWSSHIPTSADIAVWVHGGVSAAPDCPGACANWTNWAVFNNGDNLGVSMDGMPYVQWRASFTTVDVSTSPTLYDFTIRYQGYDSQRRGLISSVFDTGSSSNSMREAVWNESLPGTTDATFQLRTSSSTAGVWSSWMGPDGTDQSYFTDSAGGEAVPYALRDGADDRFFQYQVWLQGDGLNTPTVSVASPTYGSVAIPTLDSLTPDSSTQITLGFTDNSDDEDDFRPATGTAAAPINDVASFPTSDKPGTGGSENGSVSNLLPNTLYYLRLRSHETANGGYSSFSNELSTYTHASPPAEDAAPYVPAAASVNIFIDINGNPAGTQYYAERDTDPLFPSPTGTGWSVLTSKTFGGLTLGTTYYFRAKARNTYGIETATAAFHAAQPVDDPTALAFTDGSSVSMTANWGPGANVGYIPYRAQISTVSDFTGAGDVLSPWSTAMSYAFNSLGANTTYYFRVKSRNPSGDESASWVSLGSTMTAAAPPSALAPFTAPEDNRVETDWGANTNPAGTIYTLQRSTDSSFVAAVFQATTTATKLRHHWGTLADAPSSIYYGASLVYPSSGGYIYALRGWASASFWRYNIDQNSWDTSPTDAPNTVYYGGAMVYPEKGGYIYTFRGYSNATFWRYNIDQDSWDVLADAPSSVGPGAKLVYPGMGDWIYATRGNNSTTFWRYSISGNNWEVMTNAPGTVDYGGALIYPGSGDYFYAFQGDLTSAFWRYSISGDNWDVLANAPDTVRYGGSLAYPGSGDWIYALRGYNTTTAWRYSISGNNWEVMDNTPVAVNQGGYMVYPSSGDYFYAYRGANTSSFWSYRLSDELAPQTTYYYRVRAQNGAGALTAWTDLGLVGTNVAQPRPAEPAYTNRAGDRITVNWTSAGNPTGTEYYFEISQSSDFTTGLQNSGWLADLFTYQFLTLNVNTAYYFRGKARKNGIPASETSWLEFTPSATTPNAPGAMAHTNVSSVSVTANWTQNGNPGGTEYLSQRATDGGFTQNVADSGWTTAVSTALAGLTPNTYYYFRAKAKSPAGDQSPWTDLPDQRTYAASPGAPFLDNVTGTSARLNWSQNNNPSGTEFWAEVGTSSNPWVGFTTAGWITSTLANFTGLASGTTYYFRAKARDADLNDTAWTAVISTMTPIPPIAPSGLDIDYDQITAAQTDRLHVFWLDNSSDEDGFTLDRSTDGITFNWTTGLAADTTEYASTGLDINTSYYYVVRAFSAAAGDSADSNTKALFTYAAEPGAASYPAVDESSVTITWGQAANPGWTRFIVDISSRGDFSPVAFSSNTADVTALFDTSALEANTTYFARVQARNGNWIGTAFTSNITTVTPANPPVGAVWQAVWASSLTVSWNVNSNPGYTRFVAELSTASDFSGATPSSTTMNAFAEWTSLAADTTYYTRVKALNESGRETATAAPAGSAITLADEPGVFAGPYDVFSASAAVRWDTGVNPVWTEYRAQRSAPDDPGFTIVQDDSGWQALNGAYTFWSPPLNADATYYFRVRARNGAGTEAPSGGGWVILPSTQTLTNVPTFIPPDVYVASITALWGANNGPGTEFLAEASGQSDFSTIASSSDWQTDITSFNAEPLLPNTRYFVRVRTRNSSRTESSNLFLYNEYTRAADPGGPLIPYTRTGTDIVANWNATGNPSPDTTYFAVRSSSADFSVDTASSAWIVSNSYSFGGLSPGGTYYFRVKARNANAAPLETGWSVLPSSPTLAAPTPAPSGLVLSYPDGASTDRLALDWSDNSTGETGFRIYESSDSVSYNLKDPLGPDVVTYLSVGLSSDTRYYYKVAAFNANGESFTNIASSFTRAAQPAAGVFSNVLTNSLTLDWGDAGNPAGSTYICELATSSDFTTIDASSQTLNLTADFAGLEANATYYAQVKAVNGQGVESAYRNLSSTRTDALTMSIEVSDIAPGSITQNTLEPFAKLVLTPSGAGSQWTGVAVTREGSGGDADAARVSVYRDANGSGAYEGGNDPEAGWATFVSSVASIPLAESISGPTTYFINILEANNYISWPGNTIGVSLQAVGDFISPNSYLSLNPEPFTGGLASIVKVADVLNVSGFSVAPMPNVSRGVNNIGFLRLALAAVQDRVYLNQILVEKIGTLDDSYVNFVKLYEDSNLTGTLEVGGGDTMISSGIDVFTSSQALIQILSPSTRTITNIMYFVTLDLGAGSPLDDTIGVRIADANSLNLMTGTPDTVSLAVTPTDSNTPAVSDPPNILMVTPTDMGGGTIEQGELRALEMMEMTTNSGNAVWTQVVIQRAATSADSDYSMIGVYRDNPPYGVFSDATDALVASGTFSAGQATFDISETVTFTSTKTYFLAVSISPSANTGNQAGVRVQSGNIKALSAQTSIVAPFPMVSTPVTIIPTVDIVSVTPDASVAPGIALQGATNVPVLGLTMAADDNAADLSAITFTQIGTAVDADISALRLYLDDGDTLFNAGSDSVVSLDGSFSGGSAVVSFTGLENITTAPKLYFVAADIAAGATPTNTLQLRIVNSSSFSVIAPDIVTSTWPVDSNSITLEKLVATVQVTTTSLAPASAEAGTTGIDMVKITLASDQSTAQLNSFSALRTGGLDSDVTAVALYWDANGNGPEPSELLSSGPFSGGVVTLPAYGQAKNLSTTPKDYYVQMDFSAGAVIGNTVGLNFTAISVAAPDGIEAGALPFPSGGTLVAEPPSSLQVWVGNELGAAVTQGNSSVLVASMTLSASAYTVDWNRIDMLRAGSGTDSDIDAVRLYRDNGNGVWGGVAEETSITSGVFSGGLVSLGFVPEGFTAPASSRTYYVSVDIADTAGDGNTFGINMPAASYLGVQAPDTVNSAAFPFSSALATINATVDTLTVIHADLAPAVNQGDTGKALGRLTVQADANTVSLTNLRLDKTGTALDSDITGIKLYLDDGSGTFDGPDTIVAQAPSLTNGAVNLLLAPAQSVGTSAKIYFAVVDFSASATVGATFGLEAPTANFSVVNPDTVTVVSPPASFSIAGGIIDAPDAVTVTFTDLASSSLFQGQSEQPMAKLGVRSGTDQALWTGVRINLSGSASLPDLGLVKLYRDADASGGVSAGDVLVASDTFAGALLTLSMFLPEAITTTARDYILTLDVAAGAVIGNTVGFVISDQSQILLSGIDTVNAFGSQATTVGEIKDPSVPTPPVVDIYLANNELSTRTVTYNAYESLLKYRWTSSVYQGSIQDTYYYVGDRPAASTFTWTSAGTQNSIELVGLNLTNASTYFVSVRVKNSLGNFYSDIASKEFIVDSVKPAMAPGTTSGPEGSLMKVSWPPATLGPSGLAYYKVEERKGSSPLWTTLSTTSGNSFFIADTGPGPQAATGRPAGTYFYRVSAVNGAGMAGDPGEVVTVQLGLEGLSELSGVAAYPNPFDSRQTAAKINFTLNAASQVDIYVYDIFGGKVATLSCDCIAGVNEVSWDGTDDQGRKVSKGVYIAVLKALGSLKKLKIGVIH